MPRLKNINFLPVITGICLMAHISFAADNLKPARLAGSWYPAMASELETMIDKYASSAGDILIDADIGVVISPHAGYVFSGPVAQYGFRAASARKVSTVVILAPSHHFSFEGASVWAEGAFETPLGKVVVDEEMAAKVLAYDKRFVFRKDVFNGLPDRPENSVETQIPFIQRTFPRAKIVPIILGYPPDMSVLQAMAEALSAVIGRREDVLVDVSVDQSHFHQDDQARLIDARGLRAIEMMDVEAFLNGHRDGSMEVDGFHVVTVAMLYAKRQGFNHVKVLKYATSADVTGDKSRVVGYASVIFYRETGSPVNAADITQEQRQKLLSLARKTLEVFLRTGKPPDIVETEPRLYEREGAFVTLHKQGRLRGCIGNIIGNAPLYETVRDMAVAAASQDPRFDRVTADELKDIDIEISVLSTPRKVAGPDEIEMGRHGVIVSRGIGHRGVFLPQVAVETGWSREDFLSELCSQKAGLPADCWKDPSTSLEVFTATVFGEKR